MNRLIFFLLTAFSLPCLAQEQAVEVGKHANVNFDAASMILSLLMVLVLIVASAWVLKRFNMVNKSVSGMKVIASLPLGTKEKLVVVQVGDEQLLLGVSQQQVTLLKTLETPLEVGAPLSPELNQTVSRFFAKSTNK